MFHNSDSRRPAFPFEDDREKPEERSRRERRSMDFFEGKE
jgi:hypothetical protein